MALSLALGFSCIQKTREELNNKSSRFHTSKKKSLKTNTPGDKWNNLSTIFNETECQCSTPEDNNVENSRPDWAVGTKEILSGEPYISSAFGMLTK